MSEYKEIKGHWTEYDGNKIFVRAGESDEAAFKRTFGHSSNKKDSANTDDLKKQLSHCAKMSKLKRAEAKKLGAELIVKGHIVSKKAEPEKHKKRVQLMKESRVWQGKAIRLARQMGENK